MARLPHSLVTSWLCNAFEMLRVSATIKEPELWRLIHYETNVGQFEAQHGVETRRDRYNERNMARALRRGTVVRGQHAGLTDLFAPIVAPEGALGVLVAGPFATARPTSSEIRDRWRSITGRQAHLADPEFADYLSITLSTLTLEGTRPKTFEHFLGALSCLLAGTGDPVKLLTRAEALRNRLEEARSVDRMLEVVRTMLDERSEQSWQRPYRSYALSTMGLSRPPDSVAVGLIVSTLPDIDPVDDVLRREAFQRASVSLLNELGDAISGNVGDYGVVMLSAYAGSASRKRARLLELGERLNKLARRHAFDLHLGLSSQPIGALLSAHYQSALAAAQVALSRGERVVQMKPGTAARPPALGELGRELCGLVEEQPLALPARFERYLEAVALHSGHRVDPARAYLESSYGELAATLQRSGALDAKSLTRMCSEASDSARECRTIKDLFGLYRRAVADLTQAAQRPVPAHRERSVRRAVDYIHEHYAERLTLGAVSRVAGFAPNYFSRLFKEREHVTFAHYLKTLRTDRAKHLLETSELGVERVGRLAGFATPAHFFTVFKSVTGTSPSAYRKRAGKG